MVFSQNITLYTSYKSVEFIIQGKYLKDLFAAHKRLSQAIFNIKLLARICKIMFLGKKSATFS
jgi:hypothetical protein